ncbi:PKD domain-containing protein [Pollutibacter soli]|uniref:PKD domain-containing protein n=1 Tax=Pollutibacter soli TaxID=3034157 RepID=UPI0030138261
MSFSLRTTATGDTIRYTQPLSFCQGESVLLIANNAPAGASFQWTKDNADINGAIASSYRANTSGRYSVVVTSGVTKTYYDTLRVTVWSKPVADFTFNNDSTCSGTVINFNSTVTNGTAPFTYAWTFADGSKATAADVNRGLQVLGCGTFSGFNQLIVTDANGCSDTVRKPIKVIRKPEVSIRDLNIFSPFSNCENSPTVNNPNYTIKIDNNSPDKNCISTYTVNWGDGTVQNNLTAASFPLEHTYTKLGAFNLAITGKGTNGCSNTATYVVANQSNPAGGLGTLGNTTGLCAPATLPFIISNWQDNSPGTFYVLNFGDGDSVILTHPLNPGMTPDTVYHTYTKSSCPNPTFVAVLKVINACDVTPYTAGNIQIRIKPEAAIDSILPVCVNQNVCFVNSTILGNWGSTCSELTEYSWNFGDPSSGSNNTSTQTNPCHTYAAPGIYTVTLTAKNPCGTTTATRTVCVMPKPVPLFSLDNSSGCAPFTVNITNNSTGVNGCKPATYKWTVDYASDYCGTSADWKFAAGSSETSADPKIIFNNPGKYAIKLTVTSPCGEVTTTKIVEVKKPPTVIIKPIPTSCGPTTFTPSATITNCGNSALTYLWTFEGGTPATSTNLNPGNVSFSTAGVHKITLAVTNECGTTTASETFIINALPDLQIPQSDSVCNNAKAGPYLFSSATPGTSITWVSSNPNIGLPALSGSGNIAEFIAKNTFAVPQSATITVTATQGGCKSDNSFIIKVNPSPSAPVVVSPVQYCQEENAVPLSATLTGKNLNWYGTETGGTASSTAPTPSTVTVGTKSYWVSQTSFSVCESPRSRINVIVNPIPSITGSFTSPLNCGSATGSIILKGLTTNTLFTVRYLKNGNAQTISANSGTAGEIVISSLSAGTYSEIYVESTGCPSNKVGPYTLTDPNPPTTPVATSNGPICSGSELKLMSTGTGGIFRWTGPNGFISTSQNPVIQNAGVNASGLYTVTREVNGCLSVPASVTVTVNQTPSITQITSNSPICEGNPLQLSATVAGNLSLKYSWSGPDNFTSDERQPLLQVTKTSSAGEYRLKIENNAGGCSDSDRVQVVIKQVPQITDIVSNDPATCNSSSGSIQLKGLKGSTTYQIKYKRNGVQITNVLQSNATGVLELINLNAATYSDFIITLDGCSSDTAGPVVLSDPNPPAKPVAGNDQEVCTGGNVNLTVSGAPAGAIYTWTGPAGFTSNLQNPSIPSATLANGGIYTVFVTVSGCVSPSDTVVLTVHPTPENISVKNNGPVCAGADVLLSASASGAGNLSYLWSGPDGFSSTEQNPKIIAAAEKNAGTYTVKIIGEKGNCSVTGNTQVIIHKLPRITGSRFNHPTSCASSTGSITLSGLDANTNYRVSYKKNGIAQSAEIISNALGELTITSLSSGAYTDVQVTLNNCPSNVAGPFTLSDPNPPLPPTALSNGPVCAGATIQLNVSGVADAGITYAWTGPQNFISTDKSPVIPNVTLENQGEYRVTVTVNNCTSQPGKTVVVINPLPVAPKVQSPVEYCIGATASPLTAEALPAHQLRWYTTEIGGTNLPQTPTPSTLQTGNADYWVSQVSDKGCEGPRQKITVIIRPDAKAAISVPVDTACTPFVISIANTSPAGINSNYHWFADQTQLNSGVQFPGYTLNKPDDSVTITMVAVSVFGCKTDTVRHEFYTKPVPVPSFTISDSIGCGPLTVRITNTTPEMNRFSFLWDFGNGIKTNVAQPGDIIFPPDPDFGDTTFTIRLKAFAGCDTVILQKTVLVKSKPKSLFTPDKSFGCSPMRVVFTNISRGNDMNFIWDFGDGQRTETSVADTISHTFFSGTKDTFFVKLISRNSCGSDTMQYAIAIAPNNIRIDMAVNATELSGCLPHTANLINNSRGASLFKWDFGDGTTHTSTKNIDTVRHTYLKEGIYIVRLNASNGCSDTSTTETIKVFSTANAAFTTQTINSCSGDSVRFINQSDSADSYLWQFGDGQQTFNKNPVHFFKAPGTYNVKLTTFRQNPDGFSCSDTAVQTIIVTQKIPDGVLIYEGGNKCVTAGVRFEYRGNFTDTLIWNFGDATTIKTTETIVFHQYTTPGKFVPSLLIISANVCSMSIVGKDTIVVDKVEAGFSHSVQNYCGYSMLNFKDSSQVYFSKASVHWLFGDGTEGTGTQISHRYAAEGQYNVSMIITAASGCTDTLTKKIYVDVFDVPLASINKDIFGCTEKDNLFTAVVQSRDSVNLYKWLTSSNATGNTSVFNFKPTLTGNYNIQLIVGTVNGCFDTVATTTAIYKTPQLARIEDKTICAGTSVKLVTTGASQYQWQPASGLSCSNCADPVASPNATTNYIVRGINAEGCFSQDTILVKVIHPFKLQVKSVDTLCIGQSVTLNASGAFSYNWTPSTGLSNPNIPNPVASPASTTRYRVIGYDENHCFSDTAFVEVAVGGYSTISLGPDVTVPTGTQQVLQSTITGPPVKTWSWDPGTNLSCSNCADPVATVKNNIIYTVNITNIYGCPATDTLQIKTFCENAQVFIPNAFTPDGDGHNDKLLVRAKGIATVKYFRIFNRWGELVFERNNFQPNDINQAWDGKVRGKVGGPEVFVYTAEVICENGATYVYKGNVSIIK